MSDNWQDQAACRGTYTDEWFPRETERVTKRKDGDHQQAGPYAELRLAKRICARCPVSAECLEFAITHRIEYGIWGGMSSKQISKLIRERKDAKAADCVSGGTT